MTLQDKFDRIMDVMADKCFTGEESYKQIVSLIQEGKLSPDQSMNYPLLIGNVLQWFENRIGNLSMPPQSDMIFGRDKILVNGRPKNRRSEPLQPTEERQEVLEFLYPFCEK